MRNTKVYDFEDSQKVIQDAWDKAIEHLKTTLGDQYVYNTTDNVLCDFYDKVEQDIKFKKQCPCCDTIDIEGNFLRSIFEPSIDICYTCYQEELGK